MKAFTVEVDGLTDTRCVEGVEYWGRATRQSDGTYQCLANVGGSLCRVEVSLTPDPWLLAAFEALW